MDDNCADIQQLREQLAAAQARADHLALAIEGAGLGVWEWNVQTNETAFNERWAGMLGRTIEELTPYSYATWEAFVHPDDLARAIRALRRCIDGETEHYSCEFRMLHKDGHWVWVLDQGRVMRHDAQGRPLRMHGTHTDITARREAELAARESGLLLREAVQSALVGLWKWDLVTNKVWFSDEWKRQVGHEPHEIPNDFEEWRRRVHPDDLGPTLEAIERSVSERARHHNVLFRFQHKDGSWRWILAQASVHCDADGNPAQMLGSHLDITQAKRDEEALRASEEFQRAIIDSSPLAIMTLDPQGVVLSWNAAAERMFGWAAEEAIGQVLPIVREENKEEFAALRARVLAGESFSGVEVSRHRRDGTPIEISLSTAPLRDPQGQPRAIVGIITDVTDRKHAERALRESEARLVNAQRLARVGDFSWDTDTNDVSWSAALYELLGREPGAPVDFQTVDREIHHPEDRERITAWLLDGLAAGAGQLPPAEYRLRRADGAVLEVVSTGQVVPREGRGPLFFGTIHDITERKRAERALEENRRFLADLIEHNEALFFAKDAEGRYRLVNRKWEVITGIPREEVLGRTDTEIFAPPTGERFRRNDQEVLETGRAIEREELLPGPEGLRTFNSVKFPWRDSRGAIIGVCGFTAEITGRKRAEQALRESEARFATAFRSSPAPLVLSEIDTGEFLDLNDRWAELLEFTREEQLGRASKDVGIWEDPSDRDRLVCRLREHGRLREEPATLLSKSGRQIPVLWSAEVVQVAGRDVMLSMITDLTAIRAAEAEHARLVEQLNQSQKLESVGRLAGGVAHDFNNMLNVILGNAELLQDLLRPALPPSHEAHARLEEIQSAGARSADLTRQLLAFARKQVAAPRVVDLNDVVGSMLRMVQRLIGEQIVLEWRPSPSPAVVCIDPAQVDQVLANLCVNSRDAIGPRPGRIVIEAGATTIDAHTASAHEGVAPGPFVVLSIRDDGCGIPPHALPHLFEPFFTTKGVGEGTGLGLPMVYGIVRQNKGFIQVESQPGEGTVFRVHLPGHQAAPQPAPAPPARPLPRGNGTVLLVEDEPAILRMTSTMLAHLGYTVLAAGTPAEALELAGSGARRLDLLLTDVIMPQMNGRNLAERLAATQPAMKCLYMSGYTADVIAHEGVLDPGVQFLQKPFTLRELGQKLREAMEA